MKLINFIFIINLASTATVLYLQASSINKCSNINFWQLFKTNQYCFKRNNTKIFKKSLIGPILNNNSESNKIVNQSETIYHFSQVKSVTDIPSFNEWKHRVKEFQKEKKQQISQNGVKQNNEILLSNESDNIINLYNQIKQDIDLTNQTLNFSSDTQSSSTNNLKNEETPIVDENNFFKNYASSSCGAKILNSNNEAINANGVIQKNKDEYMLNTCNTKIWFIMELCEPIELNKVEIANLELFSSLPKEFRIFLNDRYPTKDWLFNVTFMASEERKPQAFTLVTNFYARYLKFELLSHYGNEHFCPLTSIQVFGKNLEEEFVPDDQDHESDHIIAFSMPNKVEETNLNAPPIDNLPQANQSESNLVIVDPLKNDVDEGIKEYQDSPPQDHKLEELKIDLNDTIDVNNFAIPLNPKQNLTSDVGNQISIETQNGTGVLKPPIPSKNFIKNAKSVVSNIINHASHAIVPPDMWNGKMNMVIKKRNDSDDFLLLNNTFEKNISEESYDTSHYNPLKILELHEISSICHCCTTLLPHHCQLPTAQLITYSTLPRTSHCFEALLLGIRFPELDICYRNLNTNTNSANVCSFCKPSTTNPDSSFQNLNNSKDRIDTFSNVCSDDWSASTRAFATVVTKSSTSSLPFKLKQLPSAIESSHHMASQQATLSTSNGFFLPTNPKESIFMRLNNRIKAIESNLTLTGRYLDELSKSYVRNIEDTGHNFDKIFRAINSTSKLSLQRYAELLKSFNDLAFELNETKNQLSLLRNALFPSGLALYRSRDWLSNSIIHVSLLAIELSILVAFCVWVIPNRIENYMRHNVRRLFGSFNYNTTTSNGTCIKSPTTLQIGDTLNSADTCYNTNQPTPFLTPFTRKLNDFQHCHCQTVAKTSCSNPNFNKYVPKTEFSSIITFNDGSLMDSSSTSILKSVVNAECIDDKREIDTFAQDLTHQIQIEVRKLLKRRRKNLIKKPRKSSFKRVSKTVFQPTNSPLSIPQNDCSSLCILPDNTYSLGQKQVFKATNHNNLVNGHQLPNDIIEFVDKDPIYAVTSNENYDSYETDLSQPASSSSYINSSTSMASVHPMSSQASYVVGESNMQRCFYSKINNECIIPQNHIILP